MSAGFKVSTSYLNEAGEPSLSLGLPAGPATATGPALTPPPPPFGVYIVTGADEPQRQPTAEEIAAVLALPVACQHALRSDIGPGWTVYPQGDAVPRLRLPHLAPDAVWLPAGIGAIVDAIATSIGSGRRAALAVVGLELDEGVTVRLAALRALARSWR